MSLTDLEDLKAFYELSECTSAKEAAKRLGISQPALSKRLFRLREECGTDLFIKGRRPLQLTKAGNYLRCKASLIISMCREIEDKMPSFEDRETGLVIMGYTELIPFSIMTPFLTAFAVEHPDISLEVRRLTLSEIMSAEDNARADIFLVSSPCTSYGLTPVSKVHPDRWGILLPAGLEQASRSYLTPEHIDNMPLIIPREPSRSSQILETLYSYGSKPSTVHTYSSFDEALAIADGHIGMAFMPLENSPRIDDSRFVLLPFSPSFFFDSVLAVREDRLKDPAAELFIDFMKKDFR